MTNVKVFAVAALAIITVAFTLVVVGVATKGWVIINNVDIGYSLKTFSLYAIVNTAYALCIISTLGAAIAMVAISMEVIMKVRGQASEQSSSYFLLATHIASTLGGLCGIFGSIIHAVFISDLFSNSKPPVQYTPGYSFFLTIIGSIFLIVGGALTTKAKQSGQALGS